MNGHYFVIQNSEGDTTVTRFTKEELETAIAAKDWGDKIQFHNDDYDVLESADTNYWGNKILIIKGRVVEPQPVTVVKTYTVD
jgi:hypothetical protein